MKRKAYIDTQRLARDFEVGDTVLLPIYTRGNRYAPSLGHVTAVLDKIGFIDVETPFGNIRMSPENLVKDPNADASYLEDTSYDTWERRRSRRVASRYLQEHVTHLWKEATLNRRAGLSEIQAFQKMANMGSSYEVQEAVSYVYANHLMTKEAIYWKAKGRRYMPSQREVSSGDFECPCCKHLLAKTHYKKHTKLYVCRECLFTIRPADMLEPGQVIDPCEEAQEFTSKSPVDFFTPQDPLLKAVYED
jgi:hypothetical protein